ncbi:DUF5714 domain-containing protein [Methanolapillus ohkumae]|uniref:DUF5714 domain-containing protein n=1 Tax=Methanolapillus ohkumae TaxID=3028298 RepID=A0AA96V703_9EURY|nr:hypothetical protein MsAm2_08090 [Methanosarcinaceae archaeon Am2]
MKHTSGCLICGKSLVYSEIPKNIQCFICKADAVSIAECEDGHYVCDQCHFKDGYEYIENFVRAADGKNPIAIAETIMKSKLINMHGPEHHFLVTAALLAAYKNSGGAFGGRFGEDLDFKKALEAAQQRTQKVPGGICGMWGSCGAGISAGIFVSLVTKATPLSEKEWSLANQMTAQCLNIISQNGGPRCCKRDTILALRQAIAFTKSQLNVEMDSSNFICSFFPQNSSCKVENCLFYPKSTRNIFTL